MFSRRLPSLDLWASSILVSFNCYRECLPRQIITSSTFSFFEGLASCRANTQINCSIAGISTTIPNSSTCALVGTFGRIYRLLTNRLLLDGFHDSSLFAVIVLPNGGKDLESVEFKAKTCWREAASIFWQVARTLGVAEELVRFEVIVTQPQPSPGILTLRSA